MATATVYVIKANTPWEHTENSLPLMITNLTQRKLCNLSTLFNAWINFARARFFRAVISAVSHEETVCAYEHNLLRFLCLEH